MVLKTSLSWALFVGFHGRALYPIAVSFRYPTALGVAIWASLFGRGYGLPTHSTQPKASPGSGVAVASSWKVSGATKHCEKSWQFYEGKKE